MPIIVGAPRSGTTLLRFMLDAHPSLAIPPETGFLPVVAAHPDTTSPGELYRTITAHPPGSPAWGDFGIDAEVYESCLRQIPAFSVGEGVRTFYRMYAAKHRKIRYGDKTPMYCLHMPAIQALLPEAHFIHIIRDGRDVALSLRKMWFAPGKDIPTLATYWRDLVHGARAASSSVNRYMEVRYEALIHDPESVLRSLCSFIELDFCPQMLRYWEHTPERLKEHRLRRNADGSVIVTHEGRLEQQQLTMQPPRANRVFAWRTDMAADEQREFNRIAHDTLSELGYD